MMIFSRQSMLYKTRLKSWSLIMQKATMSGATGDGCEPEISQFSEESSYVSHRKLFRFTKFVKIDNLDPQERLIHQTHLSALQLGLESYIDPATGYEVLTRLCHLRRGNCCGNACRHCPFGHQEVPVHIPKKRFNSAFYI